MQTNINIDKKFEIGTAIKYLKGGMMLNSIVSGEELLFRYTNNKVFISGENKNIIISEYEFLSLYKDCLFYISEENVEEEAVDIKKDEEYYSWRQ
jgi:hypothetical protein